MGALATERGTANVMRDGLNATTVLLTGLTAIFVYLCYLLFRPYAAPILFALVLAIIFHPLHSYSRRLVHSRSAAALISMLLAVVLTAAPMFYLVMAVRHELADLYRMLATKSADAGGVTAYLIQALQRSLAWSASHFPFPQFDVREVVVRRIEIASASLVSVGAGLLRNVLSFVADAVIACFVLFFLFRDGESLLENVSSMMPLGPGRFDELKRRISATVVANFYGGIAVGVAQGGLTALAFWVLGIDSPVLWGLVTAVFSLLPVVGSAAVWVPAAIVLLFTGQFIKALILLAFGTAVIGVADNIVRPWVVSEKVRLHTVYVFFALLGGLQVFGVMGLFLGPVILSVTAALAGMLQEELKTRAQAAGQS
jgi:predicted PurR-regulated permease PerM